MRGMRNLEGGLGVDVPRPVAPYPGEGQGQVAHYGGQEYGAGYLQKPAAPSPAYYSVDG